jgi:DNA-binding LacI/PurR family transcriptional regulator
LIGSIDSYGTGAERRLRMLLECRVGGILTGILTAGPQMERDAGIGGLQRAPVAAVSIHRLPGGGVPLVSSDYVETALLATRPLLGLGRGQELRAN